MKICFAGETNEIRNGAKLLGEHLDFEICETGREVRVGKCDCGFAVSVNEDDVNINYARKCDFYRALAIAINAMKNNKTVKLMQEPSFETCGIMIDASRRAVPKTETVKKIMLNMACMGLNRIMLYTEDTYELDGHPYFGYMRGRYTKSELKETVEFGNMLGIETVPCIQTLAHLVAALKWAEFAEVRDTWDILLIGEEKTYELIEEMIKTMRECFTTSAIHIGMDEAHDVGLGRYMEKHGFTDRLGLLCEHLTRVTEIAKKYDFEPMMWSDMFFRLIKNSKEGMTEDIAEKIPNGVSQVYWDYYSRSEKHYEERVSEHEKLACPLVFAGGIWTWSGPSVNYVQTFESTLPALKVCKEHGIKEVFATMWGDDGAECDVSEGLLGMQLYAELNYNERVSRKGLFDMFKICTGCEAELFLLLDTENYYKKPITPELEKFEDETELDGILPFSKQVLCQNPLLGLFDKNFEQVDLKTHYTELLEKLADVRAPEEYEELFDYHKQLVKILAAKCDMGICIKKAYDAGDKDKLCEAADELEALTKDLKTLYELRSRLWNTRNKPFGFEAVGNRYMGIAAMTDNAAKRIRMFVGGETEHLEELEEERLFFDSIERPFVWQMMSGRMMMP